MEHAIYAVTRAEIVGPYTLKLTFDDGVARTIDFGPVLRGELLGPLRDLDLFNRVKVDPEAQTIVWPNGADFDPATLHDWDLYESEIKTRAQDQWAKVAEERADYGRDAEVEEQG